MRIGIDIRSLQNDSQNRGIGTYTACLVKSMLSVDKENEYLFFVFGNVPLPALLQQDDFKNSQIKKVTHKKKRFVWLSGQAFFPLAAKLGKLDVFHSPEYIVPVFSQSKKVITVHDFINNDYEIYKKRSGVLRRLYFYLKDRTLAHADKVIAVSEYTKKKILEFTGIEEDRIKVIYEAADEAFVPIQDSALFLSLKHKYNIKQDFLLYVGAVDYHKNIKRLIEAFSRVKEKDIGLVLAGVTNDKKYLKSIVDLIKEKKLSQRAYILGYIPQEDLVGLYNMARAGVFVSEYEGFGLPVLEAMSCAKAVIAANNTSMVEIVGDNGLLVNPFNIGEIGEAMNALTADMKLNSVLAQKGLSRAKEFSWQKTAKETIALYKELLN